MRHLLAVFPLFILFLSSARADDLDSIDALSQAQFQLLAEDLTGVLSYKGLQPAEPYGMIGFDVGLEAGVTQLENEGVWTQAGIDSSTVPTARISVTKGLPLGFDVGGFIASAPGTSLRNYGVQLRHALVEGGVATPAIGLRAAMTRLEGVDQLAFDTRSLDLSISKGFGPVTPYAGYGRVWAEAAPDAATGLAAEDVDATRTFAGVQITLVVLKFVVEAERTGDTTGYSAKLGFGF